MSRLPKPHGTLMLLKVVSHQLLMTLNIHCCRMHLGLHTPMTRKAITELAKNGLPTQVQQEPYMAW